MANEEHTTALGSLKNLHKPGSCITRGPEHYAASNLCSYRGQARKKAVASPNRPSGKKLYDWDAYEPLTQAQMGPDRVETEARKVQNKKQPGKWDWYPRGYKKFLKYPKQGDWDVTGHNFTKKCIVPYWHEAHHIIPCESLEGGIQKFETDQGTSGLALMVKQGLLTAGYNQNGEWNMLILPMDQVIARGMELPKHRVTPTHFDHEAFNENVKTQVVRVLNKIKKSSRKHGAKKRAIEIIAEKLRPEIILAGEKGVLNVAAMKTAPFQKAGTAATRSLAAIYR
jgi:hypothetical protein